MGGDAGAKAGLKFGLKVNIEHLHFFSAPMSLTQSGLSTYFSYTLEIFYQISVRCSVTLWPTF